MATSLLCAYTLWRERQMRKKVDEALLHYALKPYLTLPFYLISWMTLLACTIMWHIKLNSSWYYGPTYILDTYCGMLMLLFLYVHAIDLTLVHECC